MPVINLQLVCNPFEANAPQRFRSGVAPLAPRTALMLVEFV